MWTLERYRCSGGKRLLVVTSEPQRRSHMRKPEIQQRMRTGPPLGPTQHWSSRMTYISTAVTPDGKALWRASSRAPAFVAAMTQPACCRR